jgi:hypothetical protein
VKYEISDTRNPRSRQWFTLACLWRIPDYTVAILNICTVKSFGKEDFPPRRFYWHDAGDEVAVVGQPRYL